jgi:hypothetical protein
MESGVRIVEGKRSMDAMEQPKPDHHMGACPVSQVVGACPVSQGTCQNRESSVQMSAVGCGTDHRTLFS